MFLDTSIILYNVSLWRDSKPDDDGHGEMRRTLLIALSNRHHGDAGLPASRPSRRQKWWLLSRLLFFFHVLETQ